MSEKKGFLQKVNIQTVIASFASFIAAIFASFGFYTAKIQDITQPLIDYVYEETTLPAYKIVESDLLKQLEKLKKDPDDIKTQDLRKFAYFCDNDKFIEFVDKQDDSRSLMIACDKVIELYSETYTP